ncbi:putative UMP-CMP kinase 1 [Capsicum annuum]|nr:putative UMP-CMP kinase 1 [Capsicum annuum]KAF3682290.1 putative UMP-CMP kinase 1 [Capsicum annuum]
MLCGALLSAHELFVESDRGLAKQKKVKVVFVIGWDFRGPGSGKGTQCQRIAQQFGYTHLSVGELLRQEINSGSETGSMIHSIMKEGKLVPSDVTVRLLQQAMQGIDNDKFLIDGFPRNEENVKTFENLTKMEPEFVLYLDCPQDEMERRLLSRNEGREDDNIDTIRKRFKVFMESTLPAVEYYESKGKIRKVDAGKSIDDVFESIKAIFSQGKDNNKVPPSKNKSLDQAKQGYAYNKYRYTSLLWDYGVNKTSNGYINDNQDPPKPKHTFIPSEDTEMIDVEL